MTIDQIFSFLRNLLDTLIVWLSIYFVLKSLRKNVKMILLFKGILIIAFLKIISDLLGLPTIGYLLNYVIMWGPLALIIIFQPEIRNVLEQLGRSQLLGRHKILTVDEREKLVYEVISATETLRKNRIGALMVFERDNSLAEYIEKSHKIDFLFIYVTSVCQHRLFLLYSYLSILSPNAKANKTVLYFRMTLFCLSS